MKQSKNFLSEKKKTNNQTQKVLYFLFRWCEAVGTFLVNQSHTKAPDFKWWDVCVVHDFRYGFVFGRLRLKKEETWSEKIAQKVVTLRSLQ